MTLSVDALYEEDFYAWTVQQAELPRRLERDMPWPFGRVPPVRPYSLEQIISSAEDDWFLPEHSPER